MLERITGFKGAIPRMNARLLPSGYATVARNTRLESGALDPMQDAEDVATLGAEARTIYRFNGQWLSWMDVVDAVPGPVAADRLYITGDGSPKLFQGGTSYDLALNPPADAPSIATTGELQSDDPEAETILYVYTFVTGFGEESPPSPASRPIYYGDGTVVTVSGFSQPQADRNVSKMRVYRSQTDLAGATTLYFVKEISINSVSFVHDLANDPMQEPINSVDYDQPPADMVGIVSMPNGMMAAFSGKQVLFCEPYIPHAWPEKYRLLVSHDVVGLVALGSSLIVLTTGTPYIMQGTHPENMTQTQLESELPCLSKRGIVDLGYQAVFPSIEGFVQIGPDGSAQVISRQIFSISDWRELNPTSITATNYNGRYMFSWAAPVGGERSLGFIDITGDRPFYAAADASCAGFWRDLTTGYVHYLAGNDTGAQVKRWDAGSPLTQVWRTGKLYYPSITSFGVIMIDADGGGTTPELTYRIYADGALFAIGSAVNEAARLPNNLSQNYEIEIETNMSVSMIQMAGDFNELMGG
ncbi:hypothetical protein DL1_08470 [Thioclava dalianensis]|uniref:Uncharacterized protein n=1 Tax=Thioclava dalianensis TaxID=1185766 RepID=A0A074TAL7_9RHOB|nr:hypothetical protein [Thioclava dalianensis]KEP68811.1 hypothetical protein DL1_08470 [Thioclava dalianensis]SFN50262.1 hypothetical protein SAMN05216224_10693 [Thioclava dalianensis]